MTSSSGSEQEARFVVVGKERQSVTLAVEANAERVADEGAYPWDEDVIMYTVEFEVPDGFSYTVPRKYTEKSRGSGTYLLSVPVEGPRQNISFTYSREGASGPGGAVVRLKRFDGRQLDEVAIEL